MEMLVQAKDFGPGENVTIEMMSRAIHNCGQAGHGDLPNRGFPAITNRSAMLRFTVTMLIIVVSTMLNGGLGLADDVEALSEVSPTERKVAECLKSGHDLLEKDDLAGAVEAYRACVQRFPNSALAHYWLGRAYFYGDKNGQAIDELKEALKLEPENMYAMRMLGRVYAFDKTTLSLAEELLSKVLKKHPHYHDARFDRACVFAQRNEFDKAFSEFARLFSQETKFARYHTELGRILAAMGRNDEARKELDRALTLVPDYAPAKKELLKLDTEMAKGKGDTTPKK